MKVFKGMLFGLSAAALLFTACEKKEQAPQLTVSGLDVAKFDTTIQAKPVKLYTLKNANGMEVSRMASPRMSSSALTTSPSMPTPSTVLLTTDPVSVVMPTVSRRVNSPLVRRSIS